MVWQIVLAEVGKGVLNEAGASAFNMISGGRQINYTAVIINAVRAIADDLKQTFQQEIEKLEFREAHLKLKTAQRLIRQYLLSPDTRKDMLDEIAICINDAIVGLMSLDLEAVNAYMIAVGLELLIIQERAEQLGSKSELKIAVCNTIPVARAHFKRVEASLIEWNETRFTPVSHSVGGTTNFGDSDWYRIHYSFNGVKYSSSSPAKTLHEAEKRWKKKRRNHIKQELERLMPMLENARDALKHFEKWAKTTEITCKAIKPEEK